MTQPIRQYYGQTVNELPSGSTLIVRPAAPARAETVRLLRDEIVSAKLLPGVRINERETSERLGVSRTTLRESLRQLEAEGLISVVPGKGSIVARPTVEQALELYEVWEALLAVAVQRLATSVSPAAVRELRVHLEAVHEAYSIRDKSASLVAKSAFYEALYRHAGNKFLAETAMVIQARLVSLRYYSLAIESRPEASFAEATRLVDAIESMSVSEAVGAVKLHVRNARDASISVMSTAPELNLGRK